MGCSSSQSIAFDTAASKPEFKRDLKDFEQLHLSLADIRKLYYVYDEMLSSGMETITLAELLAHCDLPRTAFYEKVFGIFNANQSVEISFRSFVFCTWNFCTLNRINLDMFMFDLYDKDGGRPLTPAEVSVILEEAFGRAEYKTDIHAKNVSAELQLCAERKKTFTMDKFHTFMMNHPAVIFPVSQKQAVVQNKICGAAFWQKQAAERVKLSKAVNDNSYVSIMQLLDSTKFGIHTSSRPRAASITNTTTGKKKRGSKVHIDTDLPVTPGAAGAAGAGTGTGPRVSFNNGVVTLFVDDTHPTANTKYGNLKSAVSVKGSAAGGTGGTVSSSPGHRPSLDPVFPMRLGDIPNQGSTYSQSSRGSKSASTTPVTPMKTSTPKH